MSNVRQLLDFHGIQPKKSLGQNFLHDPNVISKIADLAQIDPNHVVLEIGTGLGALTLELAQRARKVITCEVDERLVPLLRQELTPFPNVELHLQDILEADIPALVRYEPYQVLGNLPYYITSAILRKVLESDFKPQSLTVMVQREVAERLIATPNDMSLLSASVQFYGRPRIVMKVSRNVFYPKPDVESAIVHMQVNETPQWDVPDESTFFQVVRAGFSQKRKQLKNALASGLQLENDIISTMLSYAGLDGTRRAETLHMEEWAALSRAYVVVNE